MAPARDFVPFWGDVILCDDEEWSQSLPEPDLAQLVQSYFDEEHRR
jgi:hypothetical protein